MAIQHSSLTNRLHRYFRDILHSPASRRFRIASLLITIVALPMTLYLLQITQVFQSKAATTPGSYGYGQYSSGSFGSVLPSSTPTPMVTSTPTTSPTPTNSPSATPTLTPTPTPMPVQDTTQPSVAITSPKDGNTVSRNTQITIAATASDASGITKVEFLVNDNLKCTDTNASYTCLWRVPSKRNVTYRLVAKAFDKKGNVANSTVVRITSK